MQLSDDGNCFVVDSEPWVIGKVFTWVFGFLAVVMPLILVVSATTDPGHASFDCDRARGTCVFHQGKWQREVALGEIAGAQLRYRSGRRNSSGSYHVVLALKSGAEQPLSEASFHTQVTAGMNTAVVGLNQFLNDPARPSFQTDFVSTDTDWATLIPMAIASPLFFYFFLWLWVVRKVAVDRGARTLRVRTARKLRRVSDETFDFSEVTGMSISGNNGAALSITTTRGPRVLLTLPFTETLRAQLLEVTDKLAAALGVPLQVGELVEKKWRLNQR